jgi:hypothetical protein
MQSMSITTNSMSPYSWRGILDTTLCDEVYVYENWTKAEIHRGYAGSTLHNNISWREHVNLQSDDDEVCFVFYQHPKLDMYGASSLKQQSACTLVTPLEHIILIPNSLLLFAQFLLILVFCRSLFVFLSFFIWTIVLSVFLWFMTYN